MTTRRRTAVPVVVAAVCALLLTGCSGSDGNGGPSGGNQRAAVPDGSEGQRDDTREKDRTRPEGGGVLSAGPKVPSDALTPATGSFTRKERKYLTDRVPRGIDPAAVLVSGQEICQRIGRTAKADRAAVLDALRTGEIANAEPAVRHLCPQYQNLLDAAGG